MIVCNIDGETKEREMDGRAHFAFEEAVEIRTRPKVFKLSDGVIRGDSRHNIVAINVPIVIR